MISDVAQEEVDKAFRRFVGKTAWKSALGHGSFLTIEFGGSRLTSVNQEIGEFSLWVYGSHWQILNSSNSIATSENDRDRMAVGTSLFEGLALHSFHFDHEHMTLKLEFENMVQLQIEPVSDPDLPEWYLYMDDGTVIEAGPMRDVTRRSASRPS